MKLLHARPSPFVRKVMILLEEAGKTDAVTLIDGMGAPTAPNESVVAANPIGKIPCLIDGGRALYDSRVITRYLDTKFAAGLYPEGDAIWDTLTLEAHADGILDAAILCVYEVRCREEGWRSASWVEAQRGKVMRGLEALEATWLDHLKGPLDMGSIGAACVAAYLDFRAEMGGFQGWRARCPGFAAWADDMAKRPSFKATAPE